MSETNASIAATNTSNTAATEPTVSGGAASVSGASTVAGGSGTSTIPAIDLTSDVIQAAIEDALRVEIAKIMTEGNVRIEHLVPWVRREMALHSSGVEEAERVHLNAFPTTAA